MIWNVANARDEISLRNRSGGTVHLRIFRQGRNEGGKGRHNSPDEESLWGRGITAGAPKSHSNVTSTFFNTVYLLPKDVRFEHGGANSLLSHGRHPTSLRPCL